MISSPGWLPLNLDEPGILERPKNKFTPILHINGNIDWETNEFDKEGKATAFMESIFPNYDFRVKAGGHATTFNALVVPEIVEWAQENTNLYFSWFNPIAYSGVAATITKVVGSTLGGVLENFWG